MKIRSSYILLFIGVMSLLSQLVFRNQRENQQLTIIIKQQEFSTRVGIDERWREYLITLLEQEKLTQGYRLLFDRTGTLPRKNFFPFLPVQMNWLEYRRSFNKNDTEKLQIFLTSALSKTNSWDRILALGEWFKVFKQVPNLNTPYEETLFSEEAKFAYSQIFYQFDNTKDYSYVSQKWVFDKVFFHLTEEGSIEAFVPHSEDLKKNWLDNFLKLNNITHANLGVNPFSLKDVTLLSKNNPLRYFEWAWVVLSFMLIITGLALYLSTLKSARLDFLRKLTFLNQIVHEIKTPLTGLKLHLQLIQKGHINPENIMALGLSVDRINDLFDDIVAINRPLEVKKLDLITAQDLTELFQKLAQEFHHVTLTGPTEVAILTQLKPLELILRNLIKNGIRYGGSVELKTEAKPEHILLYVSDQGPGITHSESKRIFEEFYRTEEAKLKNPDGLGIGLSIVKKISLELGIVVKLENPGKKGAVFSLKIPRGQNV